jgi:hypothetical protein
MMFLIGAVVVALSGPPVSAVGNQHVEAVQLVSAFADICLKSLGDGEAQIATAEGKPWGLVAGPPVKDEKRLQSDAFALGVQTVPSNCALTAKLEKSVSLEDVEAAFMKLTGAGQASPMTPPDVAFWMFANRADHRNYAIALKVSRTSDANVATSLVSNSKGR